MLRARCRLIHDESRLLQDLEVLGDGGPADGQSLGNLADGAGALGKVLEDRAPGAIAQREPHVMSVSLYSW
jgi:hypothetical protein